MSKEVMLQELVSTGMIDGIPYYIVRNGLYNPLNNKWGMWFCAYIEPKLGLSKKIDPNDLDTQPHGGITYDGYFEFLKKKVWGWDYNHSWDTTWNKDNFLETKLQLLPLDEAIKIVTEDIEEYIGGVINETSN